MIENNLLIPYWIDDRKKMNQTLGFYIRLKALPSDTRIEIAASNVYRLFIDGELFGYGPARGAHGYSRADSYCLESYSQKDIDLVVEVYSANINSYYTVNEPPFFAARIFTANDRELASTGSFRAFDLDDRVSRVQRFSFQRTFVESYRMRACRTNFYRGDLTIFPELKVGPVSSNILINRNVPYPNFGEHSVEMQVDFGKVSVDPQAEIWKDRAIIDINENFLGYKYEELEDRLSDDACSFVYEKNMDVPNTLEAENTFTSGTYKTYKFKNTITGFVRLRLKVEKNATIYLVWDEILGEDGSLDFKRNATSNVSKYVLTGAGNYDLLAFEPVSVQYLRVLVLDGELKLEGLSILDYENSDVSSFVFSHEDRDLEKIVHAAVRTLAQNAVDVLTDCPSRERAGWLCDSYFSGKAEKVFTGKNLVEKNFLENYMMAPQLKELPKGMIPMCYPADHYDGVYIPNWSMWYVLELVNYFKSSGDKELILKSREKVYGLIDYFKQYLNEDGLLENLSSWIFIEWSKCNDPSHTKGVNYPSNMLYSAMLEAVHELYGDKELYEQGQRIKAQIIEQSYNGEFFEDNRIREDGVLTLQGHLTETCQYYAFYFDLASKEEFPELFTKMVEKFGPARDDKQVYPGVARSNAIVGNYLRLEILLRHGYYNKVIDECKAFFTKMADTTGTLWEHDYVYASLNHGFASIAGGYIIEALAAL